MLWFTSCEIKLWFSSFFAREKFYGKFVSVLKKFQRSAKVFFLNEQECENFGQFYLVPVFVTVYKCSSYRPRLEQIKISALIRRSSLNEQIVWKLKN